MNRKLKIAALAVPVISALAVAGLFAFGLPIAGVSNSDGAPVVEVETAQPATIQLTDTPGYLAMKASLDWADRYWDREGKRVDAASLPHPMGCIETAATVSMSQMYSFEKYGQIQLTVTGYSAGLGAAAFHALREEVAECKPSSTTYTVLAQDKIGAEAVRVRAQWSDSNVVTLAWRRGDVIVFAATDAANAGNLNKVAGSFDERLATDLGGVCLEQNSTRSDALRNAVFAGEKFTGRLITEEVTTEPAPLPDPPVGTRLTPVPAPPVDLPVVDRPVQPAYPVKDALPEPVAVPTPPVEPAEQLLSVKVNQRVADPAGPGCGWEFFASAQPGYDPAETATKNRAAMTKAETDLENDRQRWVDAISAYWTDYATFTDQVKTYREYANVVKAVGAQWQRVEAAWETYERELARWQSSEDAYDDFVARQDAARTEYDKAVKKCDDLKKNPALAQQYAERCPVPRPAILSQKAPARVTKPAEPTIR